MKAKVFGLRQDDKYVDWLFCSDTCRAAFQMVNQPMVAFETAADLGNGDVLYECTQCGGDVEVQLAEGSDVNVKVFGLRDYIHVYLFCSEDCRAAFLTETEPLERLEKFTRIGDTRSKIYCTECAVLINAPESFYTAFLRKQDNFLMFLVNASSISDACEKAAKQAKHFEGYILEHVAVVNMQELNETGFVFLAHFTDTESTTYFSINTSKKQL